MAMNDTQMPVAPLEGTALRVADCDTPVQLLRHRARQWRDQVALRYKSRGIWKSVSWGKYHAQVRALGMALLYHGLRRGDVVAVLAGNRPEWLFADLGAQSVGVVSAGIYPTSSPAQCQYILADCAARVVFVEDGEQLEKILAVRMQCPRLEHIVVMDMTGLDARALTASAVVSFAAWIAHGQTFERQFPQRFDAAVDAITAQDVALLVYTSGTTGAPKGAMISHANVMFQIVVAPAWCALRAGDHTLSFLPLCHIAERMGAIAIHLAFGNIVHFPENGDTVPNDLPEVAPHMLFAPPRFWEKMHAQVTLRMREAVPPAQWLYRLAQRLGAHYVHLCTQGQPVPRTLAWRLAILRPLVFHNIRRLLGLSRVRDAITGAAPVPPALITWFLTLGIALREGYGMTETCGFTAAAPRGQVLVGCAGVAAPGVVLRCDEQGEIMVRGPNVFAGYWGLPDASAQAVDAQGWLHTGDVGSLDAQGLLRVRDRLKDILITSGGKNVTPAVIENQLRLSPYIADAVVVGDGRHYLSCLVIPDEENLMRFAQDHQIPYTDFASLVHAAAVTALIAEEIARVNVDLARVEQIKAFRLIDQLLTPEDEEMTPTLKLKRRVVTRKYAQLIDDMYAT